MTTNKAKSSNLAQATMLETRALKAVSEGKIKEAIAACREMNSKHPDFASGWYTASQLATRLGNSKGALQAIKRAIQLEPHEPKWKLQLAASLMRTGDTTTARPIIVELDKLELSSGFQSALLALQLSRLELHQRALHHYQRAIRQEPDLGEHYYNLATVHRFLGDFDAAEAALAEAIRINPRDFEAYKLRSELRKQTTGSNHIESLRKALEQHSADPNASVQLNHSLAKEYEDLEQWQKSFTHLAAGAAMRRSKMRYDVQGDIDTMAQIGESYNASFIASQSAGDQNQEAIFVLGMPRTGTTLAERILASHSQVCSAGELNNFALEMSRAVSSNLPQGTAPGKLAKNDRVALSTQLDFTALGQNYINSTRPLSGQTARFIDKMPLNFLYAGLIHLALPNAKIIHLTRHPIDTCYAIYKTLFADAYPFSYDLEELGRYYAAYTRLMSHWHQVLPGIIYDQGYETLVKNLERESKALLAHCDLAWEAQCLDFHKNQQASTTASASQVRQKVYTTSVGKWRNYKDQLAPLLRTLEAQGIDPQLD